jgi:hypothetical protein
VNRGSSSNAFLLWNEGTDKWGWSDDGNTVTEFATAVLKTGDTMTGLLNVASDLVVTGNVGIGTTNPASRLTVEPLSGTSNSITWRKTGVTAAGGLTAYNDADGPTFNFGGNFSLNAGGNHSRFDNNYAAWTISADCRTSQEKLAFAYVNPSGTYTEHMRLDANGVFLVGKTAVSFNDNIRAEFAITNTATATSSGTGAAISIQNLSTTNNTYSTIYFTNSAGGVDSAIYGVHEVANATGSSRVGSLVFATASVAAGGIVERMRLNSSGNLGIGTSSPGSLLSVGSGAAAIYGGGTSNESVVHINGAGPSNDTLRGQITLSDTKAYNASPLFIASFAGKYNSSNNYTFFSGIGGGKQNTTDGNYAGYLAFYSRPHGGTNTERMRIDSSGNVGIGTSSPIVEGIDIVRSGGTSTYVRTSDGAYVMLSGVAPALGGGLVGTISNSPLIFYANNAERARITELGLFSIGTTSPPAKLSVSGGNNDVYGQFNITATGSGADAQISFSTPLNGRGIYVDDSDTNKLKIYTGAGKGNAGEFIIDNNGNVTINGSLSKSSGSFRIPHPIKPETHELVHSFVESPQADLIYSGRVQLENGLATVNIDTHSNMTEGTFVALCRDIRCFTTNESDWDAIRGSVLGNILTIKCQNPSSNAMVSWMVIGERQDQHMYDTGWTDENGKVIVEPEKETLNT